MTKAMRKKLSGFIALCTAALAAAAQPYSTPDRSSVPTFPGADGAGKYTLGGAGGKVLTVTSLADDGSEGTLRWAIRQKGARTIVFAVSGLIELQSPLRIQNDSVTIAGQTAPGAGICLKNYPLNVSANQVIIRYLRSRMGADIPMKGDDAMNGFKHHKDILIDHCSMSWSTDECASFYDNERFTLQWCIISESLAHSIHEKGSHGYGGLWGGQGATFHHNLLAHHTNRTPRLCGSRYTGRPEDEKVELFNNVIYNFGSDGAYAGEGGSYNFLNNYYKPGPYTATKSSYKRLFTAYADDGKNRNAEGVYGHFHLSGNYLDPTCEKLSAQQRTELMKVNQDNALGMVWKGKGNQPADLLAAAAFDIAEHSSLQPTWEAYTAVLESAGASLHRDAIDRRIVEETQKGTYTFEGSHGSSLGIIDQPSDVGGWPAYASEPAPADTDGDGMPDVWEQAHGLDPTNANDGPRYQLSPDYTNLEVYLNSLVATPSTPLGYEVEGNLPAFYLPLRESLTYPLAWGTDNEKDFPVWREKARRQLLACLRPAPPAPAAYQLAVIDTEHREGYAVHKIVFNLSAWSRVPAYLLVPDSQGPHAAILLLHDHGAHFSIGKEKMVRPFHVTEEIMTDADDWCRRCYDGQYVGDYLAANGYVVLAVDALFWGERGKKGGSTYEVQQALSANLLQLGMSWGALMAWDDIRSAEFLASLPMVKAGHVGAMGFSMGAHRAWMTAAATDAVQAAASVCWMNTTDSLMTPTNNQNKGGSAYSMLVPGLRNYLDYPHVASIACPKPMFFANGLNDKLFPVEGVQKAYATMQAVWDSQQAADRFQTRLYDLPHFCSRDIQRDICEFFDTQFKLNIP